MVKKDIQFVKRNGLNYMIDEDKGHAKHFKPWLGDAFSFVYDFIMENSVFPKKFGASVSRHYEILKNELREIHGQHILEIATGTGSAVHFLAKDNHYTGTDISPGLLKKAVKNFQEAGFKAPEFYVARADDLPFESGVFSVCLCILSLNFFNDIKRFIQGVRRVMAAEGLFLCSVPVPERNRFKSKIRGRLYSEKELETHFRAYGFKFDSLPIGNGALLYFRAQL